MVAHPDGRFSWPAALVKQRDGKILVRFPDIPEALTEGDDDSDAVLQASDCLSEAIAGRIADGEDIPAPSRPRRGQRLISPEPLIAAKAALYVAMKDSRTSNATLARRVGCDEKEIRRLLDPRHRSKIGRIEEALRALGWRLHVSMEAA
jgi:antitoxin HicB